MNAAEGLLAPRADDLLTQAIELDGQALARRIEAQTRAAEVGYMPIGSTTVSDLTDEAEHRIEGAAGTLDEALGMT